MNKIPNHLDLLNPLLRSMHVLGGSATIDEIYEKVVALEDIPEEILAIPNNPEKGTRTKVEYRLAWARTYLKYVGLLENSSRCVWALTRACKTNCVNAH